MKRKTKKGLGGKLEALVKW